MMSTMVKNEMMEKVEELQEVLGYLTDIYGVEFFNITSSGTKYNQDIIVYGLEVDLTKEINGDDLIMFNDLEGKLVDKIHPLAMVSLDQATKINITDDSITVLMGAAKYTITPVRG